MFSPGASGLMSRITEVFLSDWLGSREFTQELLQPTNAGLLINRIEIRPLRAAIPPGRRGKSVIIWDTSGDRPGY